MPQSPTCAALALMSRRESRLRGCALLSAACRDPGVAAAKLRSSIMFMARSGTTECGDASPAFRMVGSVLLRILCGSRSYAWLVVRRRDGEVLVDHLPLTVAALKDAGAARPGLDAIRDDAVESPCHGKIA